MIGRRGLLGLILGSPALAAAGAVEVAGISGASNLGQTSVGCDPGDTRSALQKAYDKALYEYHNEREDARTPNDYLPPHIRCKKSWSDSYKRSQYLKERRAERALWHHGIDDPATMLRALASIGKKI